jgi:hypothetical protein
MAKRVFALLVGINKYDGNGIGDLNGCIADVNAMHRYLDNYVADEKHILRLTSGDTKAATETKPTRNAVINAFRSHLRQAGKEDVALFFYSGHGSYETSPEELWQLDPSRRNQTLVCYDSRTPSGWDLADKEIASLIHEVATTDVTGKTKEEDELPHIVLIVDSCHSGSITREATNSVSRLAPGDGRIRNIGDYEFNPTVLESLLANKRAINTERSSTSGWGFIWSPHVLLAGCNEDETSKELPIDGVVQGVFTHSLLNYIQSTHAMRSYRDVIRAVAPVVKARVDKQSPKLEVLNSKDRNRLFLDGALKEPTEYYVVSQQKETGAWVVDAGLIHGVVSGGEHNRFYLYPQGKMVADIESVGSATITVIGASQSQVRIELTSGEMPNGTYIARRLAPMNNPVRVKFDVDPETGNMIRNALASNSLVTEALSESDTQFVVIGTQAGFRLRRIGSLSELDLKGLVGVDVLFNRLSAVAKWQSLIDLRNTDCRLKMLPENTGKVPVTFIIHDTRTNEVVTESTIQCFQDQERDVYPSFRISVVNNSTQRLFVSVFHLASTYEISSDFLAGKWLDPGATTVLLTKNGNAEIPFFVEEEFIELGVTKTVDVFKLIASTQEFDSTYFAQESLLSDMRRGTDRGAGDPRGVMQNRASSDWFSEQIVIEVFAQPAVLSIPRTDASVTARDAQITFHGHANFRAEASFELPVIAARSGNEMPSPNLFTQPAARQYVEPLNLAGTRNGDGPDSLLLVPVSIEAHKLVTPEAPLRLSYHQSLDADSRVLVTAWDPDLELNIPVGYGAPGNGGSTEIAIEQLPRPMSITTLRNGERSPKSAIRLAFFKVISDRTSGEYLLLAGIWRRHLRG